jgi:virginiamycin B lyase
MILALGGISPMFGVSRIIWVSATQSNFSSYQILQYPLPTGSSAPFAITSDSSGKIWVAEQGSNQIGSFDPASNVFEEYNIPTPTSGVSSIAADNSSAIWFTELNSNRLGEWHDGVIKEYNVPGVEISVGGKNQVEACGPTSVLPDRSNDIWVICIFSNQIDEFFPANRSFLTFNLPVFQSGPAGLVFDHEGNFWFSAADAAMLGHGIASQLENNTSHGITEFPPLNNSYVFTFQESTNFLGDTRNVQSSLPTPSGIALTPDGNTLWISEHVDSSFDSFNIQSQSLDRFWTSKTNNAFGFTVSLPNGIAVDNQGNVWIAEHYGNKVAEFDPVKNELTEYEVPCCASSSAGVYALTLGQNGTVWFVEIFGNAIGELKPDPSPANLSIELPQTPIQITSGGSGVISLTFVQSAPSNYTNEIRFDISGISDTGTLSGVQANFSSSSMSLLGSQNGTSDLKLTMEPSLKPGNYYLTVSARVDSRNVIYSTILKLEVVGTSTNQLFLYGAAVGGAVSVIVILFLAFRMRAGKRGFVGSSSKSRRRSIFL